MFKKLSKLIISLLVALGLTQDNLPAENHGLDENVSVNSANYISFKELLDNHPLLSNSFYHFYEYNSKEQEEIIDELTQVSLTFLTGKQDNTISYNIVNNCNPSEADKDVKGSYNSDLNQIYINLYYEENYSDIIETVLHETYHYYQFEAINHISSKNNFNDRNALIWQEEFNNYSEGNKDFYEYYYQSCEESARVYAFYYKYQVIADMYNYSN